MASAVIETHKLLVLILTAFFIINNQARPTLGATIHHPDQNALQKDMSQKSPTMRHLTWWKWGGGDKEKTKTTVAALPTTESSLNHMIPKSTETPSRWRSWFSSAKDKFSKAVDKVKTELKEAKESYDSGMSFVGNAAKEGFVEAGRAISSGAKTVGNATITAGNAIKDGAQKFGSMVKTGFQKIRLKFSGEDEKFKIVANRLKDKLEAGDEKALDLMKKLGINVTYAGDKISGSNIANKNISVTEILRNEGMLSNKSASFQTAVEQPEVDGPASADENPLHAAENEDFHSAEDYLDSVNISEYTTVKTEHFNRTTDIYLPEFPARSTTTNLPTAVSDKTATQSTQTASPVVTSTVTPKTDIPRSAITPTWIAHISEVSKSTAIVPKTAGTNLAKVADMTTPATSYKISIQSSALPSTSESFIIPIISSSSLFSATSSSEITESTILSATGRSKTILPVTARSSEITVMPTDIIRNKTLYSTTSSTASPNTSFSISSTNPVPGLTAKTASTTGFVTDTSAPLLHISTTQTPSTTDTSTSTITTTSSTSTSRPTKAVETTTTEVPVTFTTSSPDTVAISTKLATTATTTGSLTTYPSAPLRTTETASPTVNSRTPVSEDAIFIEPIGSEDGGTLLEAEPYEPPPFPDIFSDIEVHDRLREFYDKGDFSHSEMVSLFNFDPDNYEYYDY